MFLSPLSMTLTLLATLFPPPWPVLQRRYRGKAGGLRVRSEDRPVLLGLREPKAFVGSQSTSPDR